MAITEPSVRHTSGTPIPKPSTALGLWRHAATPVARSTSRPAKKSPPGQAGGAVRVHGGNVERHQRNIHQGVRGPTVAAGTVPLATESARQPPPSVL